MEYPAFADERPARDGACCSPAVGGKNRIRSRTAAGNRRSVRIQVPFEEDIDNIILFRPEIKMGLTRPPQQHARGIGYQ